MLDVLRLLAVYGGSCALVLFLVHRKLRPVTLPVALVLALLPFAFTGKAMLTGGLYGGLNLAYNTAPLGVDREQLPELKYHNGILMDQVCQVIPWRKAVRDAVKTGHWPLWNRYSRGGDVLLGLSQPAPFDPKVWIGFLLPLALAITFACSFVFFQAAAFTWLYLRELGVGDVAALVGGASYMASHFFVFWVGWSMSSVWAVLPLLVFGVHRLAHGRRGGFGATVAAGVLALVGGHPESVLHISAVAGLVLLVEWRWTSRLASTWPNLRRTLFAAVAIGALSAPAILPFVDAMVQTSDYEQRRRGISHNDSLDLVEASRSLTGAFLPWAYGRPHSAGPETKPEALDSAAGASLGGAAWMLVAVGLATPLGTRRRRWLYGTVGAVSLAVAAGLPVLTDLLDSLPLFSITLLGRLAGLAAFGLSVLAGFGAESLLRGDVRTASATRRALGTAAALLTALAFWHLATVDMETTLVRSYARSLPIVLLPALAVALLGMRVSFRRATWAAPLLLVLVFAPRPLETHSLYKTFPAEIFFPPLAELEFLPDFQADGSEPFRVTGQMFDMVPAMGALWHLEDPRGYATMRHARQHRTLNYWCDASTSWWFCQVPDLGRPFLSALGVRYLVAAPERSAAQDWKLVARGRNLSLWENPNALPRAFAPDRVLRLDAGSSPPGAMAELADFRRAAAIEFDAWPKLGPGSGNANFRRNPATGDRAEVSTRADGPDLVVTIDASEPTWIVVSETPWRGWRARIENGTRVGEPLDLFYANISMLAFEAPAGRSEVRLTFWPVSFTVGLVLAAFAILTLLALGLRRQAV